MNQLQNVKLQALKAIKINESILKEMVDDESIPAEARMCISFSLGIMHESGITLVTFN